MPRIRRLAAFLLVITLASAAPVFAQAADQRAKGPDLLAQRNIVYAKVGDLPLRLDLYLPNVKKDHASLVVWIHGGGWRKGSKDRCPFTWLTAHGYAVASVQYRLTDKAKFPAQIHDCKGALRWLRANAKKYGYNADRIGVAGISAGGHLVALLGTSGGVKALEGDVGGNLDQSSRVQAVLDMCGPSDFLFMLKGNPRVGSQPDSAVGLLFGGPVAEKRDLAKLASPAEHVGEGDPPLLIFHGSKDRLVNIRQSEHLRDLYKKADLEVELVTIPGGGHVPKQFWDKDRRDLALQFFDQHVKAGQ